MARLIVKSPYIKNSAEAAGLLNYIGTRDGVELLPAQIQLNYIGTRPRAEKHGKHGLFGDRDNVDMDEAKRDLSACQGNVWQHIISLKREDAARLGYDNAAAWKSLLRAHRNEIAAAMKIAPDDFRWYAAFHNEGDHPHVHMLAWSAKPSDGYLSKAGLAKIKSVLVSDIFRNERMFVYEQKNEARAQLVAEARESLALLQDDLRESATHSAEMEQRLLVLSAQLANCKGKKVYGYLPKKLKMQVNEIVDLLAEQPTIAEAYEHWQSLQDEIAEYYGNDLPEHLPLSKQKEFRSIKNAVVKAALALDEQTQTNEQGKRKLLTTADASRAVADLLQTLARLLQDAAPPPMPHEPRIDRKRELELRRKRQAQGQKYEDEISLG